MNHKIFLAIINMTDFSKAIPMGRF